jgi:hypothetical protein
MGKNPPLKGAGGCKILIKYLKYYTHIDLNY